MSYWHNDSYWLGYCIAPPSPCTLGHAMACIASACGAHGHLRAQYVASVDCIAMVCRVYISYIVRKHCIGTMPTIAWFGTWVEVVRLQLLRALLGYCAGVWVAHQRVGVHCNGHVYHVCTQYTALERCMRVALPQRHVLAPGT